MENIITYKCTYFNIKELVSQSVYNDRGEKAWQLFDPRLLLTIDLLREHYGPITINDWSSGHHNESRGLRTPASPYYSTFSQHTHGKAFDLIFHDIFASQVRVDLFAHATTPRFIHITSVEMAVDWLHIDVRNCDRILKFNGPITHK